MRLPDLDGHGFLLVEAAKGSKFRAVRIQVLLRPLDPVSVALHGKSTRSAAHLREHFVHESYVVDQGGMSIGGWIAQLRDLGYPGPVDDDLPEHAEALMEAIMNTAGPDGSDERAVVDRLVLQARTFDQGGLVRRGLRACSR